MKLYLQCSKVIKVCVHLFVTRQLINQAVVLVRLRNTYDTKELTTLPTYALFTFCVSINYSYHVSFLPFLHVFQFQGLAAVECIDDIKRNDVKLEVCAGLVLVFDRFSRFFGFIICFSSETRNGHRRQKRLRSIRQRKYS